MLTGRRSSSLASRYSFSVTTRTTTSPVSDVNGADAALKPSLREPSSISNSTRWPGSGTRSGFFLPENIAS